MHLCPRHAPRPCGGPWVIITLGRAHRTWTAALADVAWSRVVARLCTARLGGRGRTPHHVTVVCTAALELESPGKQVAKQVALIRRIARHRQRIVPASHPHLPPLPRRDHSTIISDFSSAAKSPKSPKRIRCIHGASGASTGVAPSRLFERTMSWRHGTPRLRHGYAFFFVSLARFALASALTLARE